METMKKFLHFYAYNFFGNFCNFSQVFEKQRRFFVFLGASLRIYIIKMRPANSFCTVYNLHRIDKVEKFSFWQLSVLYMKYVVFPYPRVYNII